MPLGCFVPGTHVFASKSSGFGIGSGFPASHSTTKIQLQPCSLKSHNLLENSLPPGPLRHIEGEVPSLNSGTEEQGEACTTRKTEKAHQLFNKAFVM